MTSLPNYTGDEPCRRGDPDRFFPTDGIGAERAKRECRGCPLRDACLDYALHTTVEGIWGGTSTGQRERMRRELGVVPAPLVAQGVGEGVHKVDRAQVLRITERGASAADAAAVVGTSAHVVRRILREHRATAA